MLSPDQARQFHQQGFLALENVFSMQQITGLKQAALEIVDDFDIDQHRTVFQTNDRDAGLDQAKV